MRANFLRKMQCLGVCVKNFITSGSTTGRSFQTYINQTNTSKNYTLYFAFCEGDIYFYNNIKLDYEATATGYQR